MHGIETPAARKSAGKAMHGTLRIEFKAMPDQSFEMHFQDDGRGLDPDQVRATAVAKGLITEDAATRLRDRQAIKLIFKSGYTTLRPAPGEAAPWRRHVAGAALRARSRRQDRAGELLGHETRFKVTLPAVPEARRASGLRAGSLERREFHEYRARGYPLRRPKDHACHRPIVGRGQSVFHFHGLDRHERRTAQYLLPRRHVHGDHRARKRRQQRSLLRAGADFQGILGAAPRAASHAALP